MNKHAKPEEITETITNAAPPAILPLLLADKLFRDYPRPRPEIARLCEHIVKAKFSTWASRHMQQSMANLVLHSHLGRARAFLIAPIQLHVRREASERILLGTQAQSSARAPTGLVVRVAPDPNEAPLLHRMYTASRELLSELLWEDFGQPEIACWIASSVAASDEHGLCGCWVIGHASQEFRAFQAPLILAGGIRRSLPRALVSDSRSLRRRLWRLLCSKRTS